ncbi:uncharacterized protein LOC132698362 [Cylas formicarius]|uniref:uncharacterized protein LOC132698362 n=1 Tax=Cylas formicarius TaxID=197179 RepID=UPI0029585111|nr:uncharacterized protein LOC132698362 [Cylas formicarius]
MNYFVLLIITCAWGVGSSPVIHAPQNVPLPYGWPFDGIANATLATIIENLGDPLIEDPISINQNSSTINGTADILNLTVTGLHGVAASFVSVSVTTLAINLTLNIPSITISANYDADLTLAQILPFFGQGQLSLTLTDSELNVYGKADLSDGLQISNATVGYKLGNLAFNVEGAYDDEDLSILVTQVLNDNVLPFLNNNEPLISQIISDIITPDRNESANNIQDQMMSSLVQRIVRNGFYPDIFNNSPGLLPYLGKF